MSNAFIGGQGSLVLGGKTYLVSPPTLRDVDTMRKRIKKIAQKLYDPLASIKDLPPGLSSEDRVIILRELAGHHAAGKISEEAFAEAVETVEGVSSIVWTCVRSAMPNVPYDEIRVQINDDNGLEVLEELAQQVDLTKLGK